eukprot:5486251-Pleurochrysis_carterae.AAC.3
MRARVVRPCGCGTRARNYARTRRCPPPPSPPRKQVMGGQLLLVAVHEEACALAQALGIAWWRLPGNGIAGAHRMYWRRVFLPIGRATPGWQAVWQHKAARPSVRNQGGDPELRYAELQGEA